VRMHPLAVGESGWLWVGAGSRPAELRTGRAMPGLRRDAALPVRQNTRQGREGGALPEPLLISSRKPGARHSRATSRSAWPHSATHSVIMCAVDDDQTAEAGHCLFGMV
jgi:hypothetical protein